IEGQINAFRLRDARVYFILQPVFGDFPLHGLYVPGKSTAEIAATSGKSKSALGASRAHGIWAADRSTLAIRNLIRLGWLRFRLPLGSAGHRLGFDLRVSVGLAGKGIELTRVAPMASPPPPLPQPSPRKP